MSVRRACDARVRRPETDRRRALIATASGRATGRTCAHAAFDSCVAAPPYQARTVALLPGFLIRPMAPAGPLGPGACSTRATSTWARRKSAAEARPPAKAPARTRPRARGSAACSAAKPSAVIEHGPRCSGPARLVAPGTPGVEPAGLRPMRGAQRYPKDDRGAGVKAANPMPTRSAFGRVWYNVLQNKRLRTDAAPGGGGGARDQWISGNMGYFRPGKERA